MLYMLDTNIISYFAEGNQNVILNLQRCLLSGNNAILVTNNEEHLGRIANLKIENWTK